MEGTPRREEMAGRPVRKISAVLLLSRREVRRQGGCHGRTSRIPGGEDLHVKPDSLPQEPFSLGREYSRLLLPASCPGSARAFGEELLWSLELCHGIWWHHGLAASFLDQSEAGE